MNRIRKELLVLACLVLPFSQLSYAEPKSGYELIKAPDFEFYDDRFNPENPKTSELYIL